MFKIPVVPHCWRVACLGREIPPGRFAGFHPGTGSPSRFITEQGITGLEAFNQKKIYFYESF
jgi:hypothetical protein